MRTGGGHRSSYLPALDGLRALAVAAVIAYHLGLPWARGGYLGVDLFFVLSGFLITGLLFAERESTGRVELGAFYARRARRLLPGLFLMLAAVVVYTGVEGSVVSTLRGDVVATLGYVANWRFVLAHQGYFAQFSTPSPLRHTWSLAIEEQYYLLWPLLLLVLVRLGRGSTRRVLGAVALLAVASAVAMGLLYHPGGDPSRAYYGTDARAFELLIGSALALWMARPWRRAGDRARRPGGGRRLWAFGAAALVALAFAWVRVADTSGWMYRGGFVAAGLLAAVVVASVARPDAGPLGRALSIGPLRWVGRLSYGMYLWHWPVIDLLTHQRMGISGSALQMFQAGVTVAAATASYYLVERPVRAGALAGWRAWVAAPSVATATVAALVLTTATSGAVAVAALAPAGVTARAIAPPASAPSPVPVLVLAAGRVPTAADPLRVLIVGDSVMYDASTGIAAALEATGVVRVEAQPVLGFGLTRSAYGWRTEWPKLVAADRPDVVLAMFGGWDGAGVLAKGRSWYAGLVEEGVRALSGSGARVVWLEYPTSRPPEIPGRPPPDQRANELGREAVNAVLAGVAADHLDTVAYLPTAPVLESGGGYTAFLPDGTGRLVRVRKHDDTHFCPAGAARVGELVLRALRPVYALPAAAPGWESGPWRLDARYDNPHGTCD